MVDAQGPDPRALALRRQALAHELDRGDGWGETTPKPPRATRPRLAGTVRLRAPQPLLEGGQAQRPERSRGVGRRQQVGDKQVERHW